MSACAACGADFTPNSYRQTKCNACRFPVRTGRRPSGVPNPIQWRAIPGYEGRYEINTLGTIRNLTTSTFVTRTFNQWGYKVRLVDAYGKKHDHFVQRLLLLAFCPISHPELYIAQCQNDNKHDLTLTNWQWGKQEGEFAAAVVLTPHDKSTIKQRIFADAALRYDTIAHEYGVSVDTIYSIMAGRR